MGRKIRNGRHKRRKLLKAQGGLCPLCGKGLRLQGGEREQRPTFDHIIPWSLGGANALTNLRLVHRGCNAARGRRLGSTPWADTPSVLARAFLGLEA